MKEYTLIEINDLKPSSVYAKVNPNSGDGQPVLVYLDKVFKGEDYEEVTEGLRFCDVATHHRGYYKSNRGCQVDYALYTRLNSDYFASWVVSHACDKRNGIGFMEVNRKLIPEMEKFLDSVDKLNVVAEMVREKLSAGFPTILDALERITGQKDLKKKIQKEPQLKKLFERIDESLS